MPRPHTEHHPHRTASRAFSQRYTQHYATPRAPSYNSTLHRMTRSSSSPRSLSERVLVEASWSTILTLKKRARSFCVCSLAMVEARRCQKASKAMMLLWLLLLWRRVRTRRERLSLRGGDSENRGERGMGNRNRSKAERTGFYGRRTYVVPRPIHNTFLPSY